jgi:hypothetical protein
MLEYYLLQDEQNINSFHSSVEERMLNRVLVLRYLATHAVLGSKPSESMSFCLIPLGPGIRKRRVF